MRGKATCSTAGFFMIRITPAYAGKSIMLARSYFFILGSPPPMRGKVICIQKKIQIIGITPAYAGKRKILGGENGGNQDHPRLCGEKIINPRCKSPTAGSPPPMRGKGFSSSGTVETGRITPAYAGKRSAVSCNASS